MRLTAPVIALALASLPLAGHAQDLPPPVAQAVAAAPCPQAADPGAAPDCTPAGADAPAPATEPVPPETGEPAAATGADAPAAAPAGTAPAVPASAEAVPAPGAAAAQDPRTEAERDFDALYGRNGYNPVADPSLPAPAAVPAAYDPWEGYNRRMHRFNNAVDRAVARPLARGYVKVVPRPVRLGVSNFFDNLRQPVSALNALLQGKPKQAGQSLGRFLLNSTLGIGGLFDPATDAKLPNKSEDFGQTLGVWGWRKSRYVELPLFGPRTLRDTFGLAADAPLSPVRQIEEDRVRVGLQGLQLVDVRAQLLATDSFREGAEDDYTLVRDAWMQRRDYQIFGDRINGDEASLPDYLREENNPTVPVDAMPITPIDGT
ncbi:phospholipid-binding lipoprotein MlaA [Vulcaniibacterium tengchongense]|uniref:Phospholipid-binding lipoprotein MlaA n=2 Tax=Vulcaniibacterium tengchongense TaxID=1273429 RepID=A0A3N4VSW5_9GAMM|nr:VacJ family lipoprotein [Vulcaniibacterium tengchongense]RPE80167.1 phospholipid-binding lipoprotein MlaA [Vulcaniibacterium tengchongense]